MRNFLFLTALLLLSFFTQAQISLHDGDLARHFDKTKGATIVITAGTPSDPVEEWRICANPPCGPSAAAASESIPDNTGSNNITINFSTASNPATAQIVTSNTTPNGTYSFRLQVLLENTGDLVTSDYDFTMREPLNLAFVMDRSGSMECAPGSPGVTAWDACASDTPDKWAMAQDAMMMIGDQMVSSNDMFVGDDRVGIVYFDGAIGTSSISTSTNLFRTINVFDTNIETDFNNQYTAGQLGRNGTGLGLGMRRAVHGFFNGDVTTPQRQVIVVVADGDQNRAPYIEEAGANAGKLLTGSCDDPSTTVVEPCGLLNDQSASDFIQVYSLWMDHTGSAGATSTLMSNMTTDPSNNYFSVTPVVENPSDPDDDPNSDGYANNYSVAFEEMFNRIFNRSTPQLINRVAQGYEGDTIRQSFTVNKGGDMLFFRVSFSEERADNFDYFLTKDGIPYEDTSFVKELITNFSTLVTVDVAADTSLDSRGQWTLHCIRDVEGEEPVRTVYGRVTDENGEPLIGVTIFAIGTTSGTITDLNGSYTIEIPEGTNELEYSYTGYRSVRRVIPAFARNSRLLINVAMGQSEYLPQAIFSATINEHRLKADYSIDQDPTVQRFGGVQVGARLRPRVQLRLAGRPLTNALVTAELIKPGDDKGDLIARADVGDLPPLNSEISNLYTARFLAVNSQNPAYLSGLALQNNKITLTHQGGGVYSGRFGRLDVTDNCSVVFRIIAQDPVLGTFERYERFSAAIRFGELEHNLAEQSSTVEEVDGGFRHNLTYTPAYRVGNQVRLVGPGFERAFGVQGATLNGVTDQGNGVYTLRVTTPERNSRPQLTLLNEPFYENRSLRDFGKPFTHFPFDISLHTGITQPYDDLDLSFDEGFFVELDLGYQIWPRLGLELIGGYYGFDPDSYILGGGLHLRYTAAQFGPGNLNRLTAAAGLGFYQPKSGDISLGYGGRVGIERSLSQRLRLLAEFGYYQIPDPNFAFGILGLGLKYGIDTRKK